jgi:hypothetical protein
MNGQKVAKPAEKTVEQTAKQMQECLARTGVVRGEDVSRVLGDPRVGVIQSVQSAYAESLTLGKK